MLNSAIVKIGGITWALWNLGKKPKEIKVLLADTSFLRIAGLATVIWLAMRRQEEVYEYKVFAGSDDNSSEDKFDFMF